MKSTRTRAKNDVIGSRRSEPIILSDFLPQFYQGWPCQEKFSRCTSPRPPSVTPRHVEAASRICINTPSLTFDEIYSIRKNRDLKTWRVPPSYDWYKRSSPGASIGLACDRADQTALSRFVSGHLRSCSFSNGNKVLPVCAKCGVASASPEHILSCLRLSRETFETDPLLASRFLEGEWAHGWYLAAARQRGISNNRKFY
ncbi:hypothetical protein AVEN_119071-1 [Araneus ventricosus]|uniref:Uncharacterized protein n=1 Tax=Araneus ventricosus TaxID=182803 RepID=A0A4Y2BKC6_ARAVE|nr:hypothetical protein AVEN_119071-1 [Araneus ventricosus]